MENLDAVRLEFGQTVVAGCVSYRLWHAAPVDRCLLAIFRRAAASLLDRCAAPRLRVLSDQCISMPPSLVRVFFLSRGKLEGLERNDECVDRVRNQCIPAMTICFPFCGPPCTL